MAKTSINLKPCKVTYSEAHNTRKTELDYVRKDLSNKNEFWSSVESLPKLVKEISDLVKEKTGRRMQEKAKPLHEAVVVINENTTMIQLQEIGRQFKEKFGCTAVQIAIHRDEGHFENEENSDRQVWKPNLHAHIVFDWYNHNTGKSVKTTKKDSAEMQTIVAKVLGMERGQSSDKKHLSPEQYKAVQEAKKEALTDAMETSKAITREGEAKRDRLISEGESTKNRLISEGEQKQQVGERYKEMNKNLYLENQDALTNAAEYRKAAKEASWRERMIAKFVAFGAFFKDQWDKLLNNERVSSNTLVFGRMVCPTDYSFEVYMKDYTRVEIKPQNEYETSEEGLLYGMSKGLPMGLWKDGSACHEYAKYCFNAAYGQEQEQGLSR